MGKRSFSKDMEGAWGLLSRKDKVLMILQAGLSIGLLVMILSDFAGNLNHILTLRIDLGLVIVLLLVSALRCYPERKKSIVLYMILLVMAVFCLVVNCFL